MGSFGVLDLGLFGVGVDMCWNFNGCGDFMVGILGVGIMLLGELEGVEKVGIVVVLGGRAWVLSLPKFFVGKYFHFWKPHPYFCINNRDNVYYPIFLTCYLIRKTNIEYAVSCIVSVPASVKIVSQSRRF